MVDTVVMKRMIQKFNGRWAVKLSILFILIAGCLIALGCVRGMSAVGWSGVAVGEDRLYVGSAEGRLVAIKGDGIRAWSEPLRIARPSGGCAAAPGGSTGGSCASSASTAVAIYGTPVVSGDFVYLSGYNGKVYAFDAPSLEPRWTYPVEDYLKPIVGGVALSPDKLFFGTSDGILFALDVAKGIKKWELQLGGKIWSTPVIDKGTVFIGSFDKKLYAIDAAEGKEKWNFPTGGTIVATALVYKDTVYIGSFDRKLYAVNAESGTKKWEFKADNWFWATPVPYENTIYAGCLDGNVYALNAQNGDKIASFATGPVASSPVLAGNFIIVANQKGEIYSIDKVSRNLKKLADLGVPVSSPLAASKDVVYAHTSNLIVNRIDIATGAKLTPIILKKE
jgi:eukaryotic-like serine/threonine-protein kinase